VLNKNPVVTINSRKYDGKIHHSWKAKLTKRDTSLFEFVGKFEKEVSHSHIGVIRRGTVSYEFYWLERWYNIFRFHEPDGSLRNFYCNINMPPQFKDGILDYVDLDVDVIVWKDFSRQILDTDEFEANSHKYAYPDSLREKVSASLNELLGLIDKRVFPFDYKF
jgi:protein associated with RNAse G/E